MSNTALIAGVTGRRPSTDMTKSCKLGFFDHQATDDSFFEFFARLRQNQITP